jgi:hypothetical protein
LVSRHGAVTSLHSEADSAELRVVEPSPLKAVHGHDPVAEGRIGQQHVLANDPPEDDEMVVAVEVDRYDGRGKAS